MKKIIILPLACLLMCGCGNNSYTCTYKNIGNEYNYESSVIYKVKDDIVSEATAIMSFDDKETTEKMCKIFKLSEDSANNLECKEKEIIINNYQKSVSDKDMTQEEFVTYLKGQKFTCN